MNGKELLRTQLETSICENKDVHVSLSDFFELIKQDLSFLLPEIERVFIALAGQSASGKSTIAQKINEIVTDSSVLSMDNYLLGWSIGKLNHDTPQGEPPYLAGLNPGVYDLDRLEEDLQKLRLGQIIDQPIFNELTKTPSGSVTFTPTHTMIVDGIYSLDSRFLRFANLAYLVEADAHDRLIRKVFRNTTLHNETANSIIKTYLTREEPSYKFHRARLEAAANLIVLNPFNPQLELQNQVKIDDATVSDAFPLQPKKETGTLKSGEKVFIFLDDERLFFCYANSGQLLLKEEIDQSTLDSLKKYYNF